MDSAYLLDILNNFNIPETICKFLEIDQGKINKSYFVVCNQRSLYVLQKINTLIFSDINALIGNFNYVSSIFQNEKRKTLTLISTNDNKLFFKDNQNDIWRLCHCIKNSISFQKTFSKEIALEAGKLLGDFHLICSKGDIQELKDNVPDFHNTPVYYTVLKKKIHALKQDFPLEVIRLFDFVSRREKDICFFETVFQQGEITKKMVHNDTKLSNMLFDKNSLKGICLIDLDTVDQGFLPYDFGDAIRSICKKEIESKVIFDVDLFEEFVKGYFSKIDNCVLKNDYNHLFKGVKIITLELLIRYLTDFISKDSYFKLDNKKIALEKALKLQTLLLSMETDENKALSVIAKYAKGKYE